MGSQAIEPSIDSVAQGKSEAFKTTAQATASVSSLKVYVDAGSTATQLVAGIYQDNNGHPGTLITQGKVTTVANGAWNTVTVPAASLTSGKTYWIALLGPAGRLQFRDQDGLSTGAMETSASTTLTSLPATWATGTVYGGAPMSAYAVGN
jgi:hypothetical protein